MNRGLLEGYAHLLEESGDYRVLRRLATEVAPPFQAPDTSIALFVDVEVDPRSEQVIEMAAVPFLYAPSGRIIAVHEPLVHAREALAKRGSDGPGTGSTIDAGSFESLVARASLAIAHNAAHDRPYAETLVPGFARLPWACSLRDVPWGVDRTRVHKLPALAAAYGFFYDAHQARDDCLAAIALLGCRLTASGATAMRALMDSADRETIRIWATGAPFHRKEILRKRGYLWNNGAGGRARAWFVEVEPHSFHEELDFLRTEVFQRNVDLPTDRVTALERYSARI